MSFETVKICFVLPKTLVEDFKYRCGHGKRDALIRAYITAFVRDCTRHGLNANSNISPVNLALEKLEKSSTLHEF